MKIQATEHNREKPGWTQIVLRKGGAACCALVWAASLGGHMLLAAGSARAGAPRAARIATPVLTLPLEPLGYLGSPVRISSGGTLYTLHFVDDTHLLLTFNSKGLMSRLPDATEVDDDRLVKALLVELPTGRIVAQTTWRTRDREQYLWALGHGSFLLRVRERLTVIQPALNLGQENPFREQLFLEMKRRIAYISVSPGGDLLTVETAPRRKEPHGPAATLAQTPPATSAASPGGMPQLQRRPPGATAGIAQETEEAEGRPPVELHFFRVFTLPAEGEKAERLAARRAGLLASRTLVTLPVTAEGFLDVLKEKGDVYDFDFETHTGKRKQLAAYDSTCMPHPYFVSRSEFVAFGCHGSAQKIELSGFNLRGEEPWVSVLNGEYISPAIITAPAASRFALSRVLVTTGASSLGPDAILPDEITSQEIDVMQNHDGRVLLKLLVTPAQRSGQNFDLSPDGMTMAVVRNEKIEIYHLPELTAADRKDLTLAAASEPERNEGVVRLISEKSVAKVPLADAVTVPAAVPEPAASVGAGPAPPTAAAPAEAATVGDLHPTDGPRKAPTLYDADHPKKPD